MRKLSITCGTTDSRETVGFNFKLETLRGDMWLSEGDVNVASNTPEAQRTIELEGNQRLVITAIGADVETFYDRENNALLTKPAFDTLPDAATRQQIEDDRQKELRDKKYGENKMNTAADRAAEQERDRVLEEQREKEAVRIEQQKRDDEAKNETARDAGSSADLRTTQLAEPTHQTPPSVTPSTPPPPPRPAQPSPTIKTGVSTSTPAGGSGSGHSGGGMTAPGPSTGGQSSKDVK